MQLQPDDPEANIDLAKDLMDMKQNQKAQALLEHALHLDPASPEAHFRLATIYREEGRIADAKLEIEQYQKFRDMKEELRKIYQEMRVQPQDEPEQGTDAR